MPKKPPVTTVDERIGALETIVERLQGNLLQALADIAFIDELNGDKARLDAFNGTQEGPAFRFTWNLYFWDAAATLGRMYDPPGRDRASIPQALKLLEDEPTIRELGVRARRWPNSEPEEAEQACIAAARSAARAYAGWLADEEGRKRLDALRELRDQNLSHSLFGLEQKHSLLYGYFNESVQATVPLFQRLSLAVRGKELPIDDELGIWRDRAKRFWGLMAAPGESD